MSVLAVPPGKDLSYLDELEAKGDYYWVDEDGTSLLEHAIVYDQIDRAIRLVEKGALINLDPRRPFLEVFRQAFYLGNARLVEYLIQDAKPRGLLNEQLLYDGFSIAVSYGDSEIIDLLLREGLSVAELGNRFPHLLVEAVYQQHMEQVWFLINGGFPLNSVASQGETALHGAVLIKNRDLVSYILDAKGELLAEEAGGVSPLGLALTLAARDPDADFEFVDMLVAHGADPCAAGLKVISISGDPAPITTIQQLLEASGDSAFVKEFAKFDCQF